MKIWEEDTNAKGGLLGRQVKLVYFDDQSNPSTVPASTPAARRRQVGPDRQRLCLGPDRTGNPDRDAEEEGVRQPVRHRRQRAVQVLPVISDHPNGPTPKPAFTRGFFKAAKRRTRSRRPSRSPMRTPSSAATPASSHLNNSKTAGFKVVYEKSYPPATTDFAPIVRAVQAANPDLFVVCSYPLDSVGMVRAMKEVGFKPKMWGGAMVGLQATVFKTQLGPLLNGLVNFETWLPQKTMAFPGSLELLKKYSKTRGCLGDPLGFYMPVPGRSLPSGGRPRDRCHQERTTTARRLYSQDDVQDGRRRREVRQTGRVGRRARDGGPVPEHQRQQHRRLPRPDHRSDRLPAAI